MKRSKMSQAALKVAMALVGVRFALPKKGKWDSCAEHNLTVAERYLSDALGLLDPRYATKKRKPNG